MSLARKWHERGKLRYVVTPRFSLSCSEAILEVCQALLQEHPDLHFTTHINENLEEIRTVAELFPWSQHYLHTYDRFGLVTERSVFAHNVHPTEPELARLAEARAAIAHCPSSNAFIGSGIFPMNRHLRHGVRFGLGSDVGGGTGFSLLKEGLMAYLAQRYAPEGVGLTPPRWKRCSRCTRGSRAGRRWWWTGSGLDVFESQNLEGILAVAVATDATWR